MPTHDYTLGESTEKIHKSNLNKCFTKTQLRMEMTEKHKDERYFWSMYDTKH